MVTYTITLSNITQEEADSLIRRGAQMLQEWTSGVGIKVTHDVEVRTVETVTLVEQ